MKHYRIIKDAAESWLWVIQVRGLLKWHNLCEKRFLSSDDALDFLEKHNETINYFVKVIE